ncbi:MAG: ABC transporter permease [Defluviitaleaceae bacterium]|nr:ABC transporter permease [Defluviitaleaceae bacterium]
MNNFMTFLGKEFMEAWRVHRILVISLVFVFFALTSPLMARYIIEIFNALIPAEDAAAIGLAMMPPPHWSQSYASFFGNLNQIGMIAMILMMMGVVAAEKRDETAALMMVKGLSHSAFILTKFIAMSLISFVVLLVSLLLQHLLTLFLFGAGAEIGNLIVSFILYWLFVVMMISLTILASTLAKNLATSAVFGFLGFMTLSIPASLPRIREAFPYTISFRAQEVSSSGYFSDMLWVNVLTAIATTALFLGISIHILRKKEI